MKRKNLFDLLALKEKSIFKDWVLVSNLYDNWNQKNVIHITNTKKLNLELASEYLLMATWLAYLKSKLLLPESDEEVFKAREVCYSSLYMLY